MKKGKNLFLLVTTLAVLTFFFLKSSHQQNELPFLDLLLRSPKFGPIEGLLNWAFDKKCLGPNDLKFTVNSKQELDAVLNRFAQCGNVFGGGTGKWTGKEEFGDMRFFTGDFKETEIDFNNQSVLALYATGSCASKIEKRVIMDSIHHIIRYSVGVNTPVFAACSGHGQGGLNLISISKIPSGYTVEFDGHQPGP